MRAARNAELFGQGEGDQEIRHRQQPFALGIKPRLRIGSSTFWTRAVIATVISEVRMAAARAAVKMPAVVRGAAALDGIERTPVGFRHALAKALPISWTMTADDVRQFHGLTWQPGGSTYRWPPAPALR